MSADEQVQVPVENQNEEGSEASSEASSETPAPETLSEQPVEAAPEEQEKVTAFDEQLKAAQAQAQSYLEGWQRERADFANYKRRMETQLKDSAANARIDVLLNLLPIVDDFELAMSSVPEELQGNSWLNGIQLVQRKFQKLLEEHNVTGIDPVGQPFDPSRHEALMMDDGAEVESGTVTATLQKGYLHGEKVLRPARVRVAK